MEIAININLKHLETILAKLTCFFLIRMKEQKQVIIPVHRHDDFEELAPPKPVIKKRGC